MKPLLIVLFSIALYGQAPNASPVVAGGSGGGGGSGCTPAGSAGQILSDSGAGACTSNTTGTGILAALANNVGGPGAPVLFNGALGTPSSAGNTWITNAMIANSTIITSKFAPGGAGANSIVIGPGSVGTGLATTRNIFLGPSFTDAANSLGGTVAIGPSVVLSPAGQDVIVGDSACSTNDLVTHPGGNISIGYHQGSAEGGNVAIGSNDTGTDCQSSANTTRIGYDQPNGSNNDGSIAIGYKADIRNGAGAGIAICNSCKSGPSIYIGLRNAGGVSGEDASAATNADVILSDVNLWLGGYNPSSQAAASVQPHKNSGMNGSALNLNAGIAASGASGDVCLQATLTGAGTVYVPGLCLKGGTGILDVPSGTPTQLDSLTASQPVLTNSSKQLVSGTATGTGNVVFSISPTLTTPALGIPSGIDLTNATNLLIAATPLTTQGDLLFANATPALGRLARGTNGQCLTSTAATIAWGSCGGASLTVGTTAITSGTAQYILYQDGSNVLNQTANMQYDATNKGIIAGGSTIGARIGQDSTATYGGLWIRGNTATATLATAAVYDDGTRTSFNAPSGEYLSFRVANSELGHINSSGIGSNPTQYGPNFAIAGSGSDGIFYLSSTDVSTGSNNFTFYKNNSGNLELNTATGDIQLERAHGTVALITAGKLIAGTGTGTSATNQVQGAAYVSGGTKYTLSTNTCSGTTTLGGASGGSFASGTTGTCTVVVTMGNSMTAPNGWACEIWDTTTTTDVIAMTASTTTTATFSGPTLSGDVIKFACMGF